MEPLYVIAVISNPVRYWSRYELYRNFAQMVESTPGAILYTVEMAFGDRPFEVTDQANPRHIQVRCNDELWHKENLINIGVSRLPTEAKYIAWVDSDILFHRPDWALETVHELQHYPVVQMWSHCQDLGPDYQPMTTHAGFGWCYMNQQTPISTPYAARAKIYWHPGYAWACRREWFDQVGGLIDYAILGSADYHMAYAMVNRMEETFFAGITQGYKDKLLNFQRRHQDSFPMDVGYVRTMISHYWHGKKVDRGYTNRWKILQKYKFDPTRQLRRDSNGLYRLEPGHAALRDDIRAYFRARNEDSVDV